MYEYDFLHILSYILLVLQSKYNNSKYFLLTVKFVSLNYCSSRNLTRNFSFLFVHNIFLIFTIFVITILWYFFLSVHFFKIVKLLLTININLKSLVFRMDIFDKHVSFMVDVKDYSSFTPYNVQPLINLLS